MAILENISSKIVDKFYDIIHKLLWDGGNAKVPFEVLFCDKCAGGLRLVNLRKKQSAVKAQWPFKVRRNSFMTEVAICNLVPNLGLYLFKCNLSADHVNYVVKSPNSF